MYEDIYTSHDNAGGSPNPQGAQPQPQPQPQAAPQNMMNNQQMYQQQIYGRYNNAGQQPNYGGYANNMNRNIQQKPPKKSGHGWFAKTVAVVCAAVLFGCIAGGTMVGVNVIAGRYIPQYSMATDEPTTEASHAVQTPETNSDNATIAQPKADTTPSSGSSSVMDVSDIVNKAMPSVVAIHGTETVQGYSIFGRESYEADASGSGIIIGENDTELLVVTNNHVVDGINNLTVTFQDDSSVDASVKGKDSQSDVAIVAIKKTDISSDTMKVISIASIGDSDDLKVGQGVIAIGNALGYGQSVTVGYVSALDREVQVDNQTTRNLLQTDAAINPGNSGGALLNMQGEVIGINSAKYSSTEVEGIGYAIPISTVQDIISALSNKPTRTVVSEDKQGYIGIQGQNIDGQMSEAYDMPKGIYVYKILDDGAAAKSDLQEKDIITKFDDQSVSTMAELKDMLTYYSGGDTVTLTVERLNGSEYKEQKVDIILGFQTDIQQN